MRKNKARPSRRTHRRKNGSIMIMVVALLVLMALIGTAYIATARIDRGSASQNADNVQIDLLVQSVLNMCKTSVTGDLFDGRGNYRGFPRDPFDTNVTNGTIPPGYLRDSYFYYNITSTLLDKNTTGGFERIDPWLADRTPQFGKTLGNPTNHYFWNRISQALTTESSATGTIRSPFEDPTYVQKNAGDPIILQFRNDDRLEPTSWLVNGVPMPAFQINSAVGNYTAVAADADGDGIADSFLVRLPIGVVNGVTYYYAVRIVDNAAAVNLNTAWGDQVKMASGTDFGDRLFPSSINLDDQNGGPGLFAKGEVNSIHAYRSGRNTGSADPPVLGTDLNYPRDDFGALRTNNDFGFFNEHDAFWMQAARRPENPGFIPSQSSAFRYHAFPLSEFVSLTPHFILAPISSGGIIDNTLSRDFGSNNSLSARSKPYAPFDTALWGDDNFNYSTNTYNRRALVVTSNSVSTITSPRYMPSTFGDLNEDGNPTNDVPSLDMLPYSVLDTGIRIKAPKYHLFQYDLRAPGATWDAGNSDHVIGDFVQLALPGNIVHTFVYARTAAKATPSPLNASTTDPGSNYWEWIPNLPTGTPMKTSLNTANFRELYRSYWSVMCNDKAPDLTPFGNATSGSEPSNFTSPYDTPHPNKQFRSSLRDIHGAFSQPTPTQPGYQGYRFLPFQQLLLRSAIAAVNTIDLRDSDDDVTSRSITLKYRGKDNKDHPVEVTIYGYEPQPFITEVYANANTLTDSTGVTTGLKNKKGYVAIELFNPHDQDFDLSGWKLGLIDRRRGRKDPVSGNFAEEKFQIKDLNVTFTTSDKVTKGGYFVLENFKEPTDTGNATDAALYRPTGVLKPTNRKYVPELGQVFEDNINTPKSNGGELVLLRPRRADKSTKFSKRPYDLYDETKIYDMVPVDSFDFTNLKIKGLPPGGSVDVHVWHYVRKNGASGDDRWKCVYGGRYDGGKGGVGAEPEESRQDATDLKLTISDPPAALFNDAVSPAPNLGGPDGQSSFSHGGNNLPPIQLGNRDFGGPNEIKAQTGSKFPFGSFMRVGDIMQVPFMGAYRVRELEDDGTGNPVKDPNTGPGWYKLKSSNTADTFLELNTISMDASFAEDGDTSDDQFENVGRFCPLNANSNYDFARRVFDYFTVIAPNEDYLPNINPDRTPDVNKTNTSLYRYPTGVSYKNIVGNTGPNIYPDPHADLVRQIDISSSIFAPEQVTGVHGQININTANAKVISSLPFTNDPVKNAAIAQAIVQYRDGDPSLPPATQTQRPFNSLFDLYNVAAFRSQQAVPADPDDVDGDFSPAGSGNTDGVTKPEEFEQQFILLNRISNLITTRSDSFTAYVIVQGWRNANTPNAELVVQRRAAMLIDRSGVTEKNREPRSMLIPVE